MGTARQVSVRSGHYQQQVQEKRYRGKGISLCNTLENNR
jgi:hypothetical protein